MYIETEKFTLKFSHVKGNFFLVTLKRLINKKVNNILKYIIRLTFV